MIFNKQCKSIQYLITDVDGVLTDGGIYTGPDGVALKKFNVKDGAGIKILQSIDITTIILSSESDQTNAKILEGRAKKIGVKHCYYGINDKYDFLLKFMNENKILSENLAYIGDDINDLKAMSLVNLKACPNDAVNEIKEIVDIVLELNGGKGCFRELVEIIKSCSE